MSYKNELEGNNADLRTILDKVNTLPEAITEERVNELVDAAIEDITADDVKFSDGETFQQKYDSGELTGPPGKDGATGPAGKDGKDGQPGATGADGKTPVKYTDYFTEADKQEIVDDVLEAMPDDSGVFFATWGKTTYAEALEAFNAGKLVGAIDGQEVFSLKEHDATNKEFKFRGYNHNDSTHWEAWRQLRESGWGSTGRGMYVSPGYIKSGTLASQIAAATNGQTPGNSVLRNSKLVDTDTTPTVNGEIFWTRK